MFVVKTARNMEIRCIESIEKVTVLQQVVRFISGLGKCSQYTL
jgi:hypothetical protein